MKKLIDINQLAEYIGVSTHTIYLWVSQRKIPYVKLGRNLRFRVDDIEQWIEENLYEQKAELYAQKGTGRSCHIFQS